MATGHPLLPTGGCCAGIVSPRGAVGDLGARPLCPAPVPSRPLPGWVTPGPWLHFCASPGPQVGVGSTVTVPSAQATVKGQCAASCMSVVPGVLRALGSQWAPQPAILGTEGRVLRAPAAGLGFTASVAPGTGLGVCVCVQGRERLHQQPSLAASSVPATQLPGEASALLGLPGPGEPLMASLASPHLLWPRNSHLLHCDTALA